MAVDEQVSAIPIDGAPTTDDRIVMLNDPAGTPQVRTAVAGLVLAIYDSQTSILTNKSIDQDGTGNSITNLANASIKAGAAIDLSKLATDPLARANHTGTQTASTISDYASATATFTNKIIDQDGTGNSITNIADASIKAGAAIALSKLNITGTPDGTKFLRDDGTWAAAGGAITPWTSDIDADGFDLTDLSNLEFRTTTGAPAGTIQAIHAESDGLYYNVPTGDTHTFKINNATEMSISNTQISLQDNNLLIGSGTMIWQTSEHTIGSSGAGFIFNVPTADIYDFGINAISEYTFSATQADWKGNNLINMGILSFDDVNTSIEQSGPNMLYDVATGAIHNFRINNGSAFTINATQIDLINKNIVRANLISFASANTSITDVSADLEYDVGTTKTHIFRINDVTEYTFSATQADWLGNNLINVGYLESNAATPASAGVIRLGLSETIAWGASNDAIRFDTGNRLEIRPAGTNEYDFSPTQADWKGNNLVNVGILSFVDADVSIQASGANSIQIDADTSGVIDLRIANGSEVSISEGAVTFNDAVNMVFDATTGTKIATATTQKLAFWNATPVVQPVHIVDATGGATVDAEARTAINAILAQMATLGLQAAA